MKRISRVNAISTALKEFDNGNFEKANKMMRIISSSISTSKNRNTFSPYIELKNKKEISLFRDFSEEINLNKKNAED